MQLTLLPRVAVFAASVLLAAPAAAQARSARVYLTLGEQLASVSRPVPAGSTALPASLAALLAGPTAAERGRGYGSAIPAGTTLSSARVDAARKVVSVTLSARFALASPPPADAAEYQRVYGARLSQVVYTVTAATGLERVSVHVPGQATRTLTRADFAPTRYAVPHPPETKVPAPADPKGVQTMLAALSYLPADAVTGVYDYRTQQAVLAFQAWEGLTRDGVVGPLTAARLATAGRPAPLAATPGHHVEIYRRRGVVLLVDGAHVVRAIHTSTGIGGDSPNLGTPPGKWRIYRKELRSWSVPYKTWLPYASYWVGGWALHGYADVPAQPASHGCARLPMPEAKLVYDFVKIGTPVQVI